jgi:hypothetical protein
MLGATRLPHHPNDGHREVHERGCHHIGIDVAEHTPASEHVELGERQTDRVATSGRGVVEHELPPK